MAELDIYIKALQAMGQSETEAKILAYLIKNKRAMASTLIEECKFSKGTVYTTTKKLVDYGYIIQSGKRPTYYSPSKRLIEDIKTEMTGLYNSIITKVEDIFIPESREELKKICEIIETNDYKLEPLKTEKGKHPPGTAGLFDYIGYGDYNIGIIFLDDYKVNKLGLLDNYPPSIYRFGDILSRISIDYQLITNFIFIVSFMPRALAFAISDSRALLRCLVISSIIFCA